MSVIWMTGSNYCTSFDWKYDSIVTCLEKNMLGKNCQKLAFTFFLII